MILCEHNRANDRDLNPCKEKKLANLRAAGKDKNVILTPVKLPTLKRPISLIRDNALLEVTPQSIRMPKTVRPIQQRRNLSRLFLKDADSQIDP
jgi:GTP-binding protein